MTADKPENTTDQERPLDPSAIRVAVYIAGQSRRIMADLRATGLQKSLDSLSKATKTPLVKWSQEAGAAVADLFEIGMRHKNHGAACLASIWLCLYGPSNLPGFGLSLDDLIQNAGKAVLTIKVNRDRGTWMYQLDDMIDGIPVCGGCVTVDPEPHWSEFTEGTA